jgi:predicted nucleotidyltransferase
MLSRLTGSLAGQPEIVFAYAHGSFAEDRLFRDVDLAVWVTRETLTRKHSLDYELDMGVHLQELFRVPVDVRLLNTASLGFRYHATRGILLVSQDDEMRSGYVERWRDAYWDYQPVARHNLAEMLRG